VNTISDLPAPGRGPAPARPGTTERGASAAAETGSPTAVATAVTTGAPPPTPQTGSSAATTPSSAGDAGAGAGIAGAAGGAGGPGAPGGPPPAGLRGEAPRGGAASALPLWLALGAVVVATVAVTLAWQARDRLQRLEAELVRRQQASTEAVAEARLNARQAQELARDASTKAALQDLRLAELTAARDEVDDVLQAVTRSRDENLMAELDAGLRIALHQAAITGSADAVLLTLRHAEDRLARASGPAIDRVRRAVAADLERIKAGVPADPARLAERLDETLRSVDGLPLLAQAMPPAAGAPAPAARAPRPAAPGAAPGPAASSMSGAASGVAAGPVPDGGTRADWRTIAGRWWDRTWAEVRALVRLTPIDHPEAALLAPEQALFVRENLKLRLLGARVALLSRRFDSAQADLAAARELLERYFDRRARTVQNALDTLRQVGAQAHTPPLPRPEATLAAIAAATGGR
jgi:uroporphyrin-III C-methyltransferase